MEASHILFLALIAAAMFCMGAAVVRVVYRGAQAARLKAVEPTTSGALRVVQWQEVTALSAVHRSWRETLRKLLRWVWAWLSALRTKVVVRRETHAWRISDPVDGTAFEPGETIVRCPCGARYHLHSWQWIGEKNSGQCVN